jgi:hypothetical protein
MVGEGPTRWRSDCESVFSKTCLDAIAERLAEMGSSNTRVTDLSDVRKQVADRRAIVPDGSLTRRYWRAFWGKDDEPQWVESDEVAAKVNLASDELKPMIRFMAKRIWEFDEVLASLRALEDGALAIAQDFGMPLEKAIELIVSTYERLNGFRGTQELEAVSQRRFVEILRGRIIPVDIDFSSSLFLKDREFEALFSGGEDIDARSASWTKLMFEGKVSDFKYRLLHGAQTHRLTLFALHHGRDRLPAEHPAIVSGKTLGDVWEFIFSHDASSFDEDDDLNGPLAKRFVQLWRLIFDSNAVYPQLSNPHFYRAVMTYAAPALKSFWR